MHRMDWDHCYSMGMKVLVSTQPSLYHHSSGCWSTLLQSGKGGNLGYCSAFAAMGGIGGPQIFNGVWRRVVTV